MIGRFKYPQSFLWIQPIISKNQSLVLLFGFLSRLSFTSTEVSKVNIGYDYTT